MARNSSVSSSGFSSNQDLGRTVAELTNQLSTSAASRDSALAAQLDQLRATSQLQANTSATNTRAVIENTAAHATSGAASALSTVGGITSSVLGTGLGLSPIIGGLLKLFGGGSDTQTLAPLVKYAAPEALTFDGQVSRQASYTDWSGSQTANTGQPVGAAGPQITVQVNAIDSRSFLDHSQEIAQAVREAMLNSHSLNGVVNDL